MSQVNRKMCFVQATLLRHDGQAEALTACSCIWIKLNALCHRDGFGAGKHELWVMSKNGQHLSDAPIILEVTADTAAAAESEVMFSSSGFSYDCYHYYHLYMLNWTIARNCCIMSCVVQLLDKRRIVNDSKHVFCGAQAMSDKHYRKTSQQWKLIRQREREREREREVLHPLAR